MKIAGRLREDDVVVVILPDSGERYLSKIYDDDWMREYGFLVPERVTPRYILGSKKAPTPALLAVDPGTTVRTALELIREHDMAQVRVMDGGRPVGAVGDVPEECVADKHEIPHFANLCDIMLKYADVEPVAAVRDWLVAHPGCPPIRQTRGCPF